MAKYLTMTAKRICCFAAFFICGHAVAQALVDPTRPPNIGVAGDTSAGTGSEALPVLQSVLISPSRVEAIVNGKTVKVGDKIGDAWVVRIAENEVVLRNGKNVEVLKLFPGIEKRTGFSRVGASAENRRQ